MTGPAASKPLALDHEVVIPPLPTGGLPIVYRIMLNDNEVREMSAATSVQLELRNDTAATLLIDDQPMELLLRPNDRSKPALEFCLSRRGDELRAIAPISGDVDVKRRISKGVSSIAKKRRLEAENASKAHTTQKLNEGEDLRPKRTKERRPPVKRPRVTPVIPAVKAADARQPPQNTVPVNGTLSLLHRRLPASVRSNTPSPHVSPPVNPQLTTGLRATNGSGGLPPRGTPPPSLAAPIPQVPTSRPSGNPSPLSSRVATPAKISSAPSSPKVGNMRAKVDVRTDVVHLLALQDMSVTDLTKRLGPRGDFEEVLKSVKVVGESLKERGKYRLAAQCWAEVRPDYAGYTEHDRMHVREKLETVSGRRANGTGPTVTSRVSVFSGSGSNGTSSSQGSAVSPSGDSRAATGAYRKAAGASRGSCEIRLPQLPQADPDLDDFVSGVVKKSDGKFVRPAIQSDEEEARYRRAFDQTWPRYCALNAALETLQNAMADLIEQRKNVAKPSEYDELDDAAAIFLKEARGRWNRYSDALNKIHIKVSSLKSRIAEWSSKAD